MQLAAACAIGASLLASGGCLSGESIKTTGGSESTSTSAGGGAGGGATTTSSAGGGDGGAGGEGSGGGAPAGTGHDGQDLVSAGQACSSPGFSMIYTVGEPTQQLGTATSPSFQIQGGLLGATGSLP